MDDEQRYEVPGHGALTAGQLDRLIEDGGMRAFRMDPRPTSQKVRPLVAGYLSNSQLMAYIFIFGGIFALFLIAVLFRLVGLAPG